MSLVTLRAGNRQSVTVPEGARVIIRSSSGVGPAGPPGPAGTTDVPWYDPFDYGAVGDGVTDDSTALQAALDAAEAAGGGQVMLWGPAGQRRFLIADEVIVRDGTGLVGFTYNHNSTSASSTIICSGSTARVKFGNWATGDDRLAPCSNFNIDGDGAGDPTGIAWFECVTSHFQNIRVYEGAGVGMYLNEAQNLTFISVDSFNNTTDNLVLDKGAGGCAWFRCSISNAGSHSLLVTQSGATAGGGYPFAPAHNAFYHCIFETGVNGVSLMELSASSALVFRDCGVSLNGAATLSSGYLVELLTNPTYPGIGSNVEFDGGVFYGGSSSQADAAFFVEGNQGPLTLAGHASFQNLGDAVFALDGTSLGDIRGRLLLTSVPAIYNVLSGGSLNAWTHRSYAQIQAKLPTNMIQAILLGRDTDNGHRFSLNRDGSAAFGGGTTHLPATGVGWGYDSVSNTVFYVHETHAGRQIRSKTQHNISSAGQASTIDVSASPVHNYLLSADAGTVTVTNPVLDAEITVVVTQNVGGGFAMSWPAGWSFAGGAPPATLTAGKSDIVTMRCSNAGTNTWFEISRAVNV